MTITITRLAKVLISNCSLFATEMLPISYFNEVRDACAF